MPSGPTGTSPSRPPTGPRARTSPTGRSSLGSRWPLLPDADAPGEAYAARVLAILKDLDPRPEVAVVRLPDLAEGEDVVEWVARLTAPRPGDGPNSPGERVRSELR